MRPGTGDADRATSPAPRGAKATVGTETSITTTLRCPPDGWLCRGPALVGLRDIDSPATKPPRLLATASVVVVVTGETTKTQTATT